MFDIRPAFAQNKTPQYISNIVNRLYENSGYPNIKKPHIKVVNSKEFAARYMPLKNEIQLEDSLIQICRSFGSDSTNALAFIIAHEYSHALLVKDLNNSPSHFVHVHSTQTGKAVDEFTSDIYGLFMSYLGGYQPERILEKLLEQVYISYNISKDGNDSYPSMSERLRGQKILYRRILPFLHLFDAANILTVKGYHELAAACYERILKIYRGVEIYNNLGVVYTLRALENFDEDLDYFAYPIELDYNTGLKKIKKSRGPLTIEMREDRKKWLAKAKIKFQEALIVNEQYKPAHFNFICAMMLSGDASLSLKYIQSLSNRKKEFFQNKQLDLLKGINYALIEDKRAHLYFKEALKSKEKKVNAYAKHNLKISKGERPGKLSDKISDVNCELWKFKDEPNPYDSLVIWPSDTIGFKFENKWITFLIPRGGVMGCYNFSFESKHLMQLQFYPIQQDHALKQNKISSNSPNLKWIEGSQGSFVECEASGYLYLLENQNRNLKGIELKIFD